MNTIPVTSTNLQGNRVRDLIEALSRLDPDVRVDLAEVKVAQNKLELPIDWAIELFNAECGTDMLSLDDLIMRYQDLVEKRDKFEKQLEDIRELLDE